SYSRSTGLNEKAWAQCRPSPAHLIEKRPRHSDTLPFLSCTAADREWDKGGEEPVPLGSQKPSERCRETDRERNSVCLCACVTKRERERESARARERETERERERDR